MSLARNLSRRTLAWGAALLLWVGFVWGNSLVGGAASSAESGRVVTLLRPLFEATGVTDLDLMTFAVRKCAHFSEYAVLGGIARTFWTRVSRELGSRASSSRRRVFLAGLVLTTLVPCLDETIQLFVPGRAGMITDVMIDCCGAATGVVLRYLLRPLMRAKKAA